MAEKLDPKELVSFKELLMANSIQIDAVAQLLIERALLPRKNFLPNSSKCRVNIKKMINRNNRCCDFGWHQRHLFFALFYAFYSGQNFLSIVKTNVQANENTIKVKKGATIKCAKRAKNRCL